MISVTKMSIEEVLLLEYDAKEDNRGVTYKNFSKRELEAVGISTEFVEERLYCIKKSGTLYGIHFQNHPTPQTKLLYCTKGRGLDFAIDLRKASKTYKKWVKIELSALNRRQIYIPAGFGHVFLSLEDDTHVVFRIDNYFDAGLELAITYKDDEINLEIAIADPILSLQDREAPMLRDSDCNL